MKNERPTVGKSIRAMCITCLGVPNGKGAYDCGVWKCALYPATPFRCKPVSKAKDYIEPDRETALVADAHNRTPKRKPSKAMIGRFCRACNSDRKSDCGKDACPLYYWRPMQKGGQPKHRVMTKVGRLVAGANTSLMSMARGGKLPRKVENMNEILLEGGADGTCDRS